jgi:uncharacterized protein YhbP (UPF0306 family)
MNEIIFSFLKKNFLLTLAISHKNIPYCANCFYVFDEKKSLIFASDEKSLHISLSSNNSFVSGTISASPSRLIDVKGVQFLGKLNTPVSLIQERLYFKKFPYSKLFKPALFEIELVYIKYTDTQKLGFAKKISWGNLPLSLQL